MSTSTDNSEGSDAASGGGAADPQMMVALARGIDVLRCFSSFDQELTSKRLCELTGLPKPTVFRITQTLRHMGMLRYSEERGTFLPTVSLLAMAAPVLARLDIRKLARPLMQQLADYADATMMISMGEGADLVVIDAVAGSKSVVFCPEIGARLSMSRTAVGRAYLLSRPQSAQDSYIARLRDADAGRADKFVQSLASTEKSLKNLGYCKAFAEARQDVWGVAVPMENLIDDQKFIFSCSILPFTADEGRLDDLGKRLVSLVHNVEGLIGKVDHLGPLQFELPRRASAR